MRAAQKRTQVEVGSRGKGIGCQKVGGVKKAAVETSRAPRGQRDISQGVGETLPAKDLDGQTR